MVFSNGFYRVRITISGSFLRRKGKIVEAHRQYQKGLDVEPGITTPECRKNRNVVSQWGTCKDEFEREDGWAKPTVYTGSQKNASVIM